MDTLIDWKGKVDDVNISFDVGVSERTKRLLESNDSEQCLPVVSYPTTDNIRDITEVMWDQTVKKADKADYLIAVACGTISGLIDIFFVGELSLGNAKDWGAEKVSRFVMKIAHLVGYKGDDLSDAIRFLEKRYPFASDSVTSEMGGGRQHHLRDFSHHFSLGGLVFSLYTLFTGKVIGTDTDGSIKIVDLPEQINDELNFVEKIVFGTIRWFFHMVSDMAGSSSSAGKGTGIPGPIVSLIKRLSSLSCFRDKKISDVEFHTWVSKLFNGTLIKKRDSEGNITESIKFDLRTEIGILHEAGKQIVPVLIDECLVRGFYFLRRLYLAIRDTEIYSIAGFKKIDSSEVLPYNNRTIRRMITVASGVFMVIDTVDAAVRSAYKNKGLRDNFILDFVARINIAGVARFVIAFKQDASFISEDIRQEKEKRNKEAREYEKTISELKCLSLNFEQLRALYSIEQLMIEDDIANTPDDNEKKLKAEWDKAWKKSQLINLRISDEESPYFFMSHEDISSYLDSRDNGPWKQLIAMEAMLFRPYFPLEYCELDKNLKKLKFKSKYLTEVFVHQQTSISEEDIASLKKAYKQSLATITDSTKKLAISAVGTAAVIAVSGGAAFVFAPAIATALAGGSAAGLYGAALTSYSLAAIGGGSIAAGGLGMAGGTAIITGGGALIGMLGGTGVSAAATLGPLNNDSLVLSECIKLLTFCKTVLIQRYSDTDSVKEIQLTIHERVDLLKVHIENFSNQSEDNNNENEKENKRKIKVAEKSLKYLQRCSKALQKFVHAHEDNEDANILLPEKIE